MTNFDFISMRAEVAMKTEDSRIARKHMEEAAARTMSPENREAYIEAVRWHNLCVLREHTARSALIIASLAPDPQPTT